MYLPNLSSPVVRNANTRFATEGINPSNIACTACHAACAAGPSGPFGIIRKACNALCDRTVCKL